MKAVRCAIYTRKSSEEGLEQDFNSLDAQREACSAYIRSQASEGWTECPVPYDDGGISGGTLQRAGLQRLLDDIAAGLIDIVVVYKVDRLTRSLLDFAKLVERFDAAGISFVSVTQSFNTTTSMGRLTLNMLLSFAQFEREVTAERIRDKIAASKARGMWMGGTPPLGYRPDGRTLAIDEEQAALVRLIHSRYRELGTVRALADWLAAEGILTPVRQTGTGKQFGGARFSRGQLYAILRNRVYIGEIVHRGAVYPGQHPSLLDREAWEAVQAQLTAHAQGIHRIRSTRQALLADRLIDAEGQRLIAVHTSKGPRRYHYYVSEQRHHGDAASGMRIPAQAIENLVIDHLAQRCADGIALAAAFSPSCPPASWQRLSERAHDLASAIRAKCHEAIVPLLERVTVTEHNVVITVNAAAMAAALGLVHAANDPATVSFEANARLRRSGTVLRLIDRTGASVSATPNDALIRLIVQARRYWAALCAERITIGTLAAREGITASYATRVLRLAFLAPTLIEAIVAGRQPANLNSLGLLDLGTDPDWARQLARAGSGGRGRR
jgi:DNA invertase Pin-like site-specific DNA recombinase